MADDENNEQEVQETQQTKLITIKSFEELQPILESPEPVCVAALSSDCALCKEVVPQLKAIADAPESAKAKFVSFDCDEVPDVAKLLGVNSLPHFFFYWENLVMDQFSGNNMEKLKVMTKACILKAAEQLALRQKQKEEEERLAAQAAAAAAAENAEGETS